MTARGLAAILAWGLLCATAPSLAQLPALFSPEPKADAQSLRLAIETYHARGWDPDNVTCVRIPYEPERFRGPPDTEFGWSPASFAVHADARSLRDNPRLERYFALLARHGFLVAIEPLEGTPRYGLTWKGFVAAGERGCFRIASARRDVRVQSFRSAGARNGRQVFTVMASSVPLAVEDWTRDPEFAALFPGALKPMRGHPEPVAYSVARTDHGFIVIKEPGRLDTSPMPEGPPWARRAPPVPADVVVRAAGTLDAKRVKDMLTDPGVRAYAPSRVCLWLPANRSDENNIEEAWRAADPASRKALTFTIYNARRLIDDREERGTYEFFRRMEAVGLVRATRLPATEFRGYPARSKVRFEFTPAAMAMMDRDDPLCLRVGEFTIEEVLWFEELTTANLRPRFVARTAFHPAPEAAALVARMGHLRRLAELGGVARGSLGVSKSGIVPELIYDVPRWGPDVTHVTLPD